MKRYKDFSVKAKISLMIGAASLLIMGCICLVMVIPLRSSSVTRSATMAQLTAFNSGHLISEYVNSLAGLPRAFATTAKRIIASESIPRELKREMLLDEILHLNKADSRIKFIWCMFEANAIDGMDAQFVNRLGSNSAGCFAPWISGGVLHAMEEEDGTIFFTSAKKEMAEVMTEPYPYEVAGKTQHLISLCIPIIVDGKFIGVSGIDFLASDLHELIKSLNQSGTGKLVSEKGTIVVCDDAEQVGKLAENGNRYILDKLGEGKAFEGMYNIGGAEMYKVYTPLQLGLSKKTWYYAVDTPRASVYAQANYVTRNLALSCSLGVLAIMLTGWLLIGFTLKDITGITAIIRKLSLGHINLEVESDSEDEIGQMKNEISKLVTGLKHTADFAYNIGEGRLDAQYNVLSNADVLGQSLIGMRQSLQKAEAEQASRKIEEDHTNWGTAGLAKFAEILRRDNNNMEAMTYNVISNIVKYLNANQGSIFVANETDDTKDVILDLKACYAFDRKKFGEKQIRPGEGLVGACYKERAPIYMTKIPDNYVNITSGLGDANPRAILIAPLKVNDEIYGVMELASFKPFEDYQREFIEKVCESIAATISSVNVNIRTSKLLDKTKIQAEEMLNAEEELRQTMEEMQATQEEMRRREGELQNVLEESRKSEDLFKEKNHWYQCLLDSFDTTPLSVTDMDKKILLINKAGLTLLGKTGKEVIGKQCGDVWGVDICKDERCGIECMKRGIEKSVFNVGDAVFSTTASYVKDLHGNNIGHVEIVSDISDSVRNEKIIQDEKFEIMAVMNAVDDVLLRVTYDPDGVMIDINDFTVEKYGVPREQLLGKRITEKMHPEEVVAFKASWNKMLEGEIMRGEGDRITATGEIRVWYLYSPIKDATGKTVKVLMIGDEIKKA